MCNDINLFKLEKCQEIEVGIKPVFHFTETQVFENGVLYAYILNSDGVNFTLKRISKNKYLNGVIKNVTVSTMFEVE